MLSSADDLKRSACKKSSIKTELGAGEDTENLLSLVQSAVQIAASDSKQNYNTLILKTIFLFHRRHKE